MTTPLEAPTAEDILKTLIGMRTERGQTDWPDTIAVAIDVIKRKGALLYLLPATPR